MHALNLSFIQTHFEQSRFALRFDLTLEEYWLLYGLSQGYANRDIMVGMGASRSTMFRLQRSLLKKTHTRNKLHAISVFAQEELTDRIY